ncbi:transglycosylase SLT domain-containing protein [Dyella sp.]|jgi:type IV secretion system protein VirB1|uniref:transglycosylase SLT domain-containing protein n=1 Tax=Dyella sp. TaxID=1869338 RepID=UPI002D7838FA|nr:transglycosylase SLT domain-containing protein [Dyella sp.]HET6431816.1 transglycosylase SLT domain-containing protein [Dyella sp.]
MFIAMPMTTCPNLAVPAEVMQHVVQVESAANPFAIGVVGGQLARQPESLDEALATVQMLDDKGYDYSLGMAQVNRRNLVHYGLDTYEKAFDSCANLTAGAKILAECYARSGNDWGRAFSCYYSGNFVTGFRDGYVQKVYASMQLPPVDVSPHAATPIALKTPQRRPEAVAGGALVQTGTGYRAAQRSVAIDTAATAAVSALVAGVGRNGSDRSTSPAEAETSTDATPQPPQAPAPATAVFEPVVRGPHDPMQAAASGPAPATAAPLSSIRPADPQQEARDAAFVF